MALGQLGSDVGRIANPSGNPGDHPDGLPSRPKELFQDRRVATGKNAHPTAAVDWAFLPDGGSGGSNVLRESRRSIANPRALVGPCITRTKTFAAGRPVVGRIGPPALPAIQEVLAGKDARTSREAAESLGFLGSAAIPALTAATTPRRPASPPHRRPGLGPAGARGQAGPARAGGSRERSRCGRPRHGRRGPKAGRGGGAMKPRVYVETICTPRRVSWSQKTMSDDPIVDEIRRVRHAHAAQFDDDLSAIVADIRRLQRERPEPYQPPAFGTGRAATAICTEPTSDADVTARARSSERSVDNGCGSRNGAAASMGTSGFIDPRTTHCVPVRTPALTSMPS